MKLNQILEEKLKSEVLVYLKKGKPGWDIPHTLTSVEWMRKLIEKEGGNEKILVTAMYLHDIGYDRLQEGYSFEDIRRTKMTHEEIGAKEAEKILKNLDQYSADETREIVYLVRYHDTLDNLNSHNRILIMEADSLAAIDWEKVTPNFDKENCLKYLDDFKKTRINKFQTDTGGKFLKLLLTKAEKYWE